MLVQASATDLQAHSKRSTLRALVVGRERLEEREVQPMMVVRQYALPNQLVRPEGIFCPQLCFIKISNTPARV